VTTQTVIYAGFWRRLLAVLLDIALVLALTAPAAFLIYGHDYFRWLFNSGDLLLVYGFWDALLSRILPAALVVFFWHQTGATPGKRLMSCKVVNAENLAPLSWQQAATRLVCYGVSILSFYIGFLWIIWDKRKQGFHDKLAKTVVIYAPDDYAELSLDQLSGLPQ